MSDTAAKPEDAPFLVSCFWTSPSEALFSQKVVAPVLDRSEAWCERARWNGTGPAFRRIGRSILYRKSDVEAWINGHATVNSTSEYQAAAA